MDIALTAAQAAAGLIDSERVVGLATKLCSLHDDIYEQAVAEFIAECLSGDSSIDVHIEDVVADRPNVIATVKGSGDRDPLVLNGHTDASIPNSGWSRDPHSPWIDGTRLFGAGITDMLGAVAAMVAAIEAAPRVDALPGDLILQAVMHHDTIGLGTKYALASEGPSSGYGICGEPSSLAIHTANGGAIKFSVELTGRTAHVSRREEGIDTLAVAVDIHKALGEASFTHDPHPRLPDLPRLLVGQLTSGTAPAAVAEKTVIRGDLRTVPGMTRSEVKAQIDDLVKRLARGEVQHRVTLTAVQKPFIGPTSGPLVETLASVHTAVRGEAPRITSELPGQAFVTDAADMAAAGLESVVYGVGDWHHAPNQFVEVQDLVDSARIYLAMALSLGHKE